MKNFWGFGSQCNFDESFVGFSWALGQGWVVQKNTLRSPDQVLPTKSRANPEGGQNDDSEVGNELDDVTLFIFESQTHRRTHRLLTRGIPAGHSTVFSLNHQIESDKGFSWIFSRNLIWNCCLADFRFFFFEDFLMRDLEPGLSVL